MFIGSTTNSSATRIFDIAEMPEVEFTAVELTGGGIKPAGENSIPVGIYNGSDVNVCGGTLWKVGGQSIVAGDFLASNENGLAVKATSGKYAFGIALTNASSSAVVEAQIINGGFVR